MLLIPCPHCGPRNQSDLRLLGEAIARPNPSTATKKEWGEYLYLRENPANWVTETWYCRAGCRKYFTVERHQATNEFRNPPLPGDKVGNSTYTTITVGSSGSQAGENQRDAASEAATSNSGEQQ